MLYAFFDGRGNLIERPAIVVKVWNDDCANMRVLLDEGDAVAGVENGIWFRSSVTSSGRPTEPRAGFWRFPPFVPAKPEPTPESPAAA